MTSRPLLDYLAYPDDTPEPPSEPAVAERPLDPLEARLKDLEARLRADRPATPAERPGQEQDLTLSAQIEAILNRKAATQPDMSRFAASRHAAAPSDLAEASAGPARVAIDPPPSIPASYDAHALDQEFLKFSEAVYLIGQAARRFIDEPRIQTRVPAEPAPQAAVAPSTGDIEALSAVLRETVSAFRSVADDLAVSAGEIRHYATRPERQPERPSEYQPEYRRLRPSRHREDDEILELRESISDLQGRLDDLLQTRRRARY